MDGGGRGQDSRLLLEWRSAAPLALALALPGRSVGDGAISLRKEIWTFWTYEPSSLSLRLHVVPPTLVLPSGHLILS